jgi:hypothetical protein
MAIQKYVFRMLVMGRIIGILVLTSVEYVEKCHFTKEQVTL